MSMRIGRYNALCRCPPRNAELLQSRLQSRTFSLFLSTTHQAWSDLSDDAHSQGRNGYAQDTYEVFAPRTLPVFEVFAPRTLAVFENYFPPVFYTDVSDKEHSAHRTRSSMNMYALLVV